MKLSSFFKSNWQHFAVLVVFVILTFMYFTPEFNGYSVKQHDVEEFNGMAQEIKMFREKFDKEPLWTNSMFGGMPAAQISVLYEGNIFQKSIIGFMRFWGTGAGVFLLHLLSFYILALCLRVKPVIAFIGAAAFALATYEIVIIQAGHNSKAATVALMAPVLGTFIMAYRNNWKWGAVLSALFMTIQLASNHLQVTYYLGILLFGLGLYELVVAFRSKQIKPFFITTLALLGAYFLAGLINYGNLTITQDYAKHTIRGGNDLSISPEGKKTESSTGGLDKDYITNWSYGKGESFTLLSPFVKGSASVGIGQTKFKEMVIDSDRSSEDINKILSAQFPVYWGEQPMTSGPVYLGVVMLFIFVMGLVFLKDNRKWVLFAVAILALMLSWGKNFMGLTDFFIDYIPGYNKFRTVTIILVLLELIVPTVAVLFLNEMYKNRDEILGKKKVFLYVSVGFVVFLIGIKMFGLNDGYSTQREKEQIANIPSEVMNQIISMSPEQLATNGIDVTNKQQVDQIIQSQTENYEDQFNLFKSVRSDIFNTSMNRSIGFAVLVIGLFAAFFYMSLSLNMLMLSLGVLVLIDLVPVGQNYLSSEEDESGNYKNWQLTEELEYPVSPSPADLQVLEMESRDPRIKKVIEKGEQEGERLADERGLYGVSKSRLVDLKKFSELNFATNYKVFSFDNPWGSTKPSYFHKNMGGYHGAKLRNVQNIFEFHLSKSNNRVYDMLNIKYFLQGENARLNPTHLGPVWFVNEIKKVDTPNDEILALGGKYELKNVGKGILLVNDESKQKGFVFGSEKIQYVLDNDTTTVQLQNGMTEGLEVVFVKDTNGRMNYIPKKMVDQDITNSFLRLIDVILVEDFDPKKEVIINKNDQGKIKQSKFDGQGNIRMTSYLPNKLTYKTSSKSPQFAVFSEIYYPDGWTAKIDGEKVDIIKSNYILRGLNVPSGDHTIEFSYDMPKLRTSNMLSIFGTILLFLMISFLGLKEIQLKK